MQYIYVDTWQLTLDELPKVKFQMSHVLFLYMKDLWVKTQNIKNGIYQHICHMLTLVYIIIRIIHYIYFNN